MRGKYLQHTKGKKYILNVKKSTNHGFTMDNMSLIDC